MVFILILNFLCMFELQHVTDLSGRETLVRITGRLIMFALPMGIFYTVLIIQMHILHSQYLENNKYKVLLQGGPYEMLLHHKPSILK